MMTTSSNSIRLKNKENMKTFQVSHGDKHAQIEGLSAVDAAANAHKLFNADHAVYNADQLRFHYDEAENDHIGKVSSTGGIVEFWYWVEEMEGI